MSKIVTLQDRNAAKLDKWEYPGWGGAYECIIPADTLVKGPPKAQLDLYRSAAIAGNDLLGSVLYTSGIVATVCGQLTPIAVLLACLALYPFRAILKETGSAIPLNGGVYVAMLNSSSKFAATFAASSSLICYSATAVVSAASCTSYAAAEFGDFPQLPVTIGVMAFIACMVLCGMKESANLALAIFIFHVTTLAILVITSFVNIGVTGGETLKANISSPLPVSEGNISVGAGVLKDLFFGFSISLLGLTGFETTPNYIEEAGPFETETLKAGPQRKVSVFERTVDNCWRIVTFINPTVALAVLGVVPLADIQGGNAAIALSLAAGNAGGHWLRILVAVDAVCILSGGVLTAFVGVTGMINQLAVDRCFPAFLLTKNSFAGTCHWAILSFWALCAGLYLVTGGDVLILSGVFAISFLVVLLAFAFANLKLKFNRPRLPRGSTSSWRNALLGLSLMLAGLIGNIARDSSLLNYFLIFLALYLGAITLSFNRVGIAEAALYVVRQSPWLEERFESRLCETLVGLKGYSALFFTKTSEVHILNKALLYTRDNENLNRLIICHVHPPMANASPMTKHDFESISQHLRENLVLLDHMYPKIKLDLLLVEAEEFNPLLVAKLSRDLDILPSFMFIRCPGRSFKYNIGEFLGIRTIMR